MKLPAALLGVFLVAGMAAPLVDAATPAVKPKASPAAPKEEPMGKIAGVTIPRANGTFLGLEVTGGNFKLSFYDKKKKPMAKDVDRATARWPNPRGPGDNRTVLNGTGTALVGSKTVLPPFTFNVYLTLLRGEGDAAQAVETFVVPYRE